MGMLTGEALIEAMFGIVMILCLAGLAYAIMRFVFDLFEDTGRKYHQNRHYNEVLEAAKREREVHMSRKTYRQGDVLIREVAKPEAHIWSEKFRTARGAMKDAGKAVMAGIEKLTDAAVSTIPREKGKIVLAYGEGTGHMHAIADKTTEFFQCDDGRRILLVNDEEAKLVHDEHDTITIPKGEYEIIHQREYDPELHSRPVID